MDPDLLAKRDELQDRLSAFKDLVNGWTVDGDRRSVGFLYARKAAIEARLADLCHQISDYYRECVAEEARL